MDQGVFANTFVGSIACDYQVKIFDTLEGKIRILHIILLLTMLRKYDLKVLLAF